MNITVTEQQGMLTLLQAFDSLFPAGAFTMSNGLETYTQKGIVRDRDTLCSYLSGYLHSLVTGDLGFASAVAVRPDAGNVITADRICTASKAPYELREGSRKMCARFIKTLLSAGNFKRLSEYREYISSGICTGHYPIAAGLLISDSQADISAGLQIYCYSLLSSAVNHAVKLVPLRQADGQSALSEILLKIPSAVKKAIDTDADDLGITGPGFDLRSMQHEGLYSRIYIS